MRILANVEVELNGEVVRKGHNLVVDAGLILLAAIISNAGATKPSHMGIGGDNSPPTAGQTALLAEVAVARTALTNSVSGKILTYTTTHVSGFFIGIGELGLFNNAAGGTMLARFTFPTLVLNIGDTLNITWKLEVSG